MNYLYSPITYFSIVLLGTLATIPIAIFYNKKGSPQKTLPFILLNLLVPCITALVLIFFSGNEFLINDFWDRLFKFNIQFNYLVSFVFLMPCAVLIATLISLLWGGSTQQFLISKDISLFGVLIPVIIVPLIEEIGWRSYGVDSLHSNFNLFTTSLIYGSLWGAWHLNLFFVKGFHQSQLWDRGFIHVFNFFIGIIVIAFLMNWVFYNTGRSIPVLVLCHSVFNLSSMLFRTEARTELITTVILFGLLCGVIAADKDDWFDKSRIKTITTEEIE